MELRYLRNFSIIAECLSISDAASLIHISQPALSRQLKLLEAKLGFVLFDRSASGVTLTEQGGVFLRSTKKILRSTEDAIREARNLGMQHANVLKVGFHSCWMPVSFFDALHDFGVGHPCASLTLTEASDKALMEQLRLGELDLIVLSPEPFEVGADCEASSLPKKRMHTLLHAEHQFASAVRIDLASMATECLIIVGERQSPGMRARALQACRRAGFEPPTIIEASSSSAMLGMLIAAQGYGLDSTGTTSLLMNLPVRSIPTLQVWESPGDSLVWQRETISEARNALVQSLLGRPKRSSVVFVPPRVAAA